MITGTCTICAMTFSIVWRSQRFLTTLFKSTSLITPMLSPRRMIYFSPYLRIRKFWRWTWTSSSIITRKLCCLIISASSTLATQISFAFPWSTSFRTTVTFRTCCSSCSATSKLRARTASSRSPNVFCRTSTSSSISSWKCRAFLLTKLGVATRHRSRSLTIRRRLTCCLSHACSHWQCTKFLASAFSIKRIWSSRFCRSSAVRSDSSYSGLYTSCFSAPRIISKQKFVPKLSRSFATDKRLKATWARLKIWLKDKTD